MVGKVRGFTLIELLVVIMVISAMTLMATVYIYKLRISTALKEAVNKITTDLSYAKTMSVATDSIWGLCFVDSDGDGYYEYYRLVADKGADGSILTADCTSSDPQDIIKEVSNIPANINVTVSGGVRFVGFSKKGITLVDNGSSYSNWAVSIRVQSALDTSKIMEIDINRAGRIRFGWAR